MRTTATITRDDADGMKGWKLEQDGLEIGILDNRIYDSAYSTLLQDMTPAEILIYAEMLKEAAQIVERDLADSALKA